MKSVDITVKLTWWGRLKVFLTGKLVLSHGTLRYMYGQVAALQGECDE